MKIGAGIFERTTLSSNVRCVLLASATALVGQQAFAQSSTTPLAPLSFKTNYFGYSAGVSPRVGYSDNIQLAPDGLGDDQFFVSNVFTANAIYSTRRFTGLFSGDLDLTYFTGDRGRNFAGVDDAGNPVFQDPSNFAVNQNVGGIGTFTVAEDLAYLDVSGSSTRQLIGDNARFSQNQNAARNQRANVNTVSISPYLAREFSNTSEAEIRYKFSKVFIDENQDSQFNNFLNDSQSQEVWLTYNTGDSIDRLTLGFTAYGNETEEDGSIIAPAFDFQQGTLIGTAEYAVTERFALTGAVGYDDIESDAPEEFIPDDELTGVFWRGGFRARPGRKTDLRIEYGERYGDDFINGRLTYDISRRMLFRADASREFQTRAQAVSTRIDSLGRRTLRFAERLREGEALSPDALVATASRVNNSIDAQTIGLGVSNRVSASLLAQLDRTSLTAVLGYDDTDFGFRAIETFTGNIQAQHRLSRKTSAYGDLFYRFADTSVDVNQCIAEPGLFGLDVAFPGFDPQVACTNFANQRGETNTIGGRIGLQYQIYRNVSAFGEYSYTNRFSPEPQLEYSENAISAGLTLSF
ncbi:MAG: hypothetical protein AAFR21_06915 [Pseudomonadota bacterium]